ncbi:phage/plasmid primase, P4 family [Rubinisphaera margarita]|uniref:phage/plasmid primase, P4 family n=1 Tax=Rubinisphaera margarita TaxID=2909586 RepID=UPI001EE8AD18|nr:phage/plasmid primase, P4 family [Rubinisphaera margarita]MCG6157101.1 phage/plasmid primase, P4 family [Rubinisphaera margarita]
MISAAMDYKTARAEVLARADVVSEMKAWGVRFASERESSGWVPAHGLDREDQNPSAAVNLSDDRFERGTFKDHATQERLSFFDVAVRLGQFPDFHSALRHFAEKTGVDLPGRSQAKSRDWGKPIAEYPYADESGNVLFKVVRMQKADGTKDCIPHAKVGELWKMGLKKYGIRRIPYRADELAKLGPGDEVWIAEGEKDADTLAGLGLVATCNLGGAGKWRREDSHHVTGMHVILAADNDDAGEAHVQKAAKNLKGRAASIRIVRFPELPRKGDVTDFIEAGGTVEQLRERALQAEEWTEPPPEPNHLTATDGTIETFTAQEATDYANARLFIKLHGQDLRYVHSWKRWLIWTGTHWRKDETGEVYKLAYSVADTLFRKSHTIFDDDERRACQRHAQRAANANGIEAFLKLAQSLVAVAVEDLNCDPWLLNCQNGTIDLRNAQLRPHSRDDLLTVICPTEFDPEAPSYHWDRFLESIFANCGDVIPFIQRLSGSALVGVVRDHILPVYWGCGANGKTTFLNALMGTLGNDYSMQAIPEMLIDDGNDRHPTEKADLYGKRFVAAVETEAGKRLKESFVKSITGGDRIRARFLYRDFFEFDPSHLIVLCTNHKPKVQGDDYGIWRRLRLVPFTETFRGKDADPTLSDKLKAEAAGILAWMVVGCLDWQNQGLNEPETVLAATEEYKNESDLIGGFIEACCYINSGMQVSFSALYEALREWCDESGENLPSRTRIGRTLNERFEQVPNVRGRWYRGLGLKDIRNED